LYGRFESKFVDADPIRRHVEKLRAAGVGARRIAELAGVSRRTISELRHARPGRPGPSSQVLRTTAEKLLAVPLPDAMVRVLAPEQRIDSVGTVRRLRALVAAGYTQDYLAGRIGLTASNFASLLRSSRCTARRHRDVVSLFVELEHTRGPSDLARRRAERLGWALPFEWDEDALDDPAAEPIADARRGRPRSAEELERDRQEARELAAAGKGTAAIAHEFGVSTRTVERYLAAAS